jgi:hypothetical protein
MKKNIMLITLALLFTTFLQAQEPKLKKIFTGKNLNGWKVLPSEQNSCWTLVKGILFVKSNADKKGSILWTEKSYENFVFQTEFLMGDGTVDSGIFLRSENDQVQIGISGSLKRDMTGSPYIPSLKYPVEAKGVKELLKLKDWNTLKIKALNKTYTVWMNGVEVMTYTSEYMIPSGPIGIQLHPGNEMSISYRKMVLGEINLGK